MGRYLLSSLEFDFAPICAILIKGQVPFTVWSQTIAPGMPGARGSC